ncbi:hypothetical protein MAM1_0164d07016 [Mucor ambiguus]|uniref:F-box domain-containing protein n=1 Tax=Mucor ambiguus TaxID=91626 RepID=A0A0C9MZ07_9FUNG|nr:hypothetical protein MAM1_0164d07016 [Mucor ambiguus]
MYKSIMRIFYYSTDKQDDPLTLLHDSNWTPPSRPLNFPPEIIQKIVNYLPRASLPSIASVNQIWYATVMPVLYRHLYVRTLPHWLLLVRTFNNPTFSAQFGPQVNSLVLKPSPRLISSQLTSSLNYDVIENDDRLQPSLRGYVRLERVNFELTGLEDVDKPMALDMEEGKQQENENYKEIDTTQKESEWLSTVTDDQAATVLKHCSQLEYLNMSGCENLTDAVLLTLASAKQTAQTARKAMVGLWMSLLRNATDAGINEMIRVERQCKLPKRLRHLDLGFQVTMADKDIQHITSYWGESLTHLRLNSIYQLTDDSAISIAHHCPHLILLHLVRCWPINNASLQLLATRCKKLKYVSVSFLSQTNEEGIKHLIQSLPELTWLDITGCNINSLFKPLILEGWANYRRQHHLTPVHIQDGSMNLL